MKAIGGYFSLELPQLDEYHKDAIKLNTGRNCLEYILRARRYNKVFIPYYTCEVILEPFKKLDIPYEFYHIDFNFELAQDITLKENEALLYTNYYGLKQRYVEKMAEKYGNHLIVDNTQAFFANSIKGIDTFYTCRKFFGVPDGAYLYTNTELHNGFEQATSYNRISHLIKRIDLSPEGGFEDYHQNEEKLEREEIKLMSSFTKRMMQSIDYGVVAGRRRTNFLQLHETLQSSNLLTFTFEDDAVPMIYPYMTERDNLREHFIQNKVFVAKYWPNVQEWTEESSVENILTNRIVSLPIDQRYDTDDMDWIIRNI